MLPSYVQPGAFLGPPLRSPGSVSRRLSFFLIFNFFFCIIYYYYCYYFGSVGFYHFYLIHYLCPPPLLLLPRRCSGAPHVGVSRGKWAWLSGRNQAVIGEA